MTLSSKAQEKVNAWLAQPDENIDLSHCELDHIPQAIIDFVQDNQFEMDEIDFSHNNFTKVPDNIAKLKDEDTHSISLDFSHNPITDFSALHTIDCIFQLDVSHTQLDGDVQALVSRSNRGFREAPLVGSCERISMSNVGLTELPDIFAKKRVRHKLFDVSHNQLKRLPQIGLDHIWGTRLDMSYNNMTEQPEWLSGITGLESLDIRGNDFTFDFSSLESHEKLEIVFADPDQLTGTPSRGVYDEATGVWNVNISDDSTEVSITGCGLTELPDFLWDMTQLTDLNISSNEGITELPEAIGNLVNLKNLYLSYTGVSALPVRLVECQKLQELGLRAVPMTALPDFLADLPDLRRIYLENSAISTLPKVQPDVWLDLQGAQITDIPADFALNYQLEELDLSGNQLTELPSVFSNTLKTLNVSKNRINSLPDSLTAKKLKTLDVSWNQLETIPDALLALPELVCDNNPLQGVEPFLAKQGGKALLEFLRDGTEPETGAALYEQLINGDLAKEYAGLIPDASRGEPDDAERKGEFVADFTLSDDSKLEVPEGCVPVYLFQCGYDDIYYVVDTTDPLYPVKENYGGYRNSDWQRCQPTLRAFVNRFEEYTGYE